MLSTCIPWSTREGFYACWGLFFCAWLHGEVFFFEGTQIAYLSFIEGEKWDLQQRQPFVAENEGDQLHTRFVQGQPNTAKQLRHKKPTQYRAPRRVSADTEELRRTTTPASLD